MAGEGFLEKGPSVWVLREKWAVSDLYEHDCDGCFKGPKGCRYPEEEEIPSSHTA